MKSCFIHVGEGRLGEGSAGEGSSGSLGSYRTGVSLHSHTLHSKESLNFIYHASRRSALLRLVLRRGEAKYRAVHGSELDLNRGWWTPPLAPRDAHRVESRQLEEYGLAPLVSITDHDDIEAGMSLRVIDGSVDVPVSVEWTVPFGPTFFHLGIHNLDPLTAQSTMEALAEFTARPVPDRLPSILAWLSESAETLIVFNHPLWDEKGIGQGWHNHTATQFLEEHRPWLHAVELNGLRPWSENRRVIELARQAGKPAISGGDRHTVEPNATINVSNAASFSEFVSEVRVDRVSTVAMMSHYHQPHSSRIFHNMLDVFRDYEDHEYGWTAWADRVFYLDASGVPCSLSELWGDRPPTAVKVFASFMKTAGAQNTGMQDAGIQTGGTQPAGMRQASVRFAGMRLAGGMLRQAVRAAAMQW